MPQVQLKTPKGTKDWEGKDMIIRDKIFSTIAAVFKRHGAVTIDTPVFELKEILAGKYGEDSKLIYDLADQAQNSSIQNIKRYHIAKVYRRDQPAMTKGRMREFYQCDFDIAGTYDPMLPDAEILRITKEIFDDLGWKGNYTIKINHRKILDGIFQVCGVPQDKIRTISSAVDKLDKSPWDKVRHEMTEEKGLDPAVADKIGQYVQQKGQGDLLEKLKTDAALAANESAKAGFEAMELLFGYLTVFNVMPKISFDMSLARGLDYYTGVIYEVVTEGSAPGSQPASHAEKSAKKKAAKGDKNAGDDEDRSNDPSVGVGSIAAGGRYDELVGMFSGKQQIPCVGISFGVDRIFSIIKSRLQSGQASLRSNEVDAYVIAVGAGKEFTGLLPERMQVCTRLWDAGLKAEFQFKAKPKLDPQFRKAEAGGVPFAVLVGGSEWGQGKVKIKELGLEDDHPEKEGVEVQLTGLVQELKTRLAAKDEQSAAAAVAGGIDGLSLA